MNTIQFPISWVRESFPALNSGDDFIFFDNGAGAQVPQTVLDAVLHHLISRSVQRGGRYRQSREVDESIQKAAKACNISECARLGRSCIRDECNFVHSNRKPGNRRG